jgi:hypothetical protein
VRHDMDGSAQFLWCCRTLDIAGVGLGGEKDRPGPRKTGSVNSHDQVFFGSTSKQVL